MLVRLRVCSLLAVFLILLPSCFGFFSFLSFPPPPPPIFRLSDVNGEDLNVQDVIARNIDANSITVNYVVARNELDLNVLHDANFFGMVESLGGFVSDLFCSFSDRENCLDLSGPVWQLNNAGLFVDGDLTGFDITANNDLDVTNDLDVLDNADIHGTLTADNLILASGGIDASADSNFTVIGVSDSIFVNNNIYASRLVDKFGFGWLDLTGDPYSFQGVDVELTQDLDVQGDANFQTGASLMGGSLWNVDKIECDNCTASGTNSVALGNSSVASNGNTIALGDQSIASGVSSVALSSNAIASGSSSIAIKGTASGTDSISIGDDSVASVQDSFAVFGSATNNRAVAIGKTVIASNLNSLAIGTTNSVGISILESSGKGSLAIGFANGKAGFPLGNGGVHAINTGSIAIGMADAEGEARDANITSAGLGSVAIGYSDLNLFAGGKGSVAIGYNVISLGEASVALGKDITCYNDNQVCVQDLNVLGDANIANLSISGVTFANDGINVLGDANFVTVGISGKSFLSDFMTLNADPVEPLQAVPKRYVDAIDVRGLVNGTIKESFNALVTSDGATVTLNLTNVSDGNLTLRFSDGDVNFNVSDNGSIALTVGSDSSPTENFIYVLQSDAQTLVKSTSSFPDGVEHTKIGYFVVPSAGFVQTNGTYVNQNWNDDTSGSDNMGDLAHIGEKLRRITASYFSGVAGNGTDNYLTPIAGTTDFKSTSGIIYQKHKHTFDAVDTNSGDVVLVANWSGDAFHDITNLFDITADSTGASIGNNKYFNLVFWGVGNKTGEFSPIMINLPSGFYNTQSAAEEDVSGHDDFSMSREFNRESSTGFLIARVTIKMAATWVVASTTDLRGQTPNTASGGVGSIIQEFADNAFKLFDETDITKEAMFNVGTISTGTTRTFSFPDVDGNLLVSNTFGDVNILRDLNVGRNLNILGTTLGVDSNFTNLGVSVGSFLNRLFVTGDSNFSNVGVSGNSFLNNLFVSSTLDFGTNTISDGQINGDWAMNQSVITDVFSIGLKGPVEGNTVTLKMIDSIFHTSGSLSLSTQGTDSGAVFKTGNTITFDQAVATSSRPTFQELTITGVDGMSLTRIDVFGIDGSDGTGFDAGDGSTSILKGGNGGIAFSPHFGGDGGNIIIQPGLLGVGVAGDGIDGKFIVIGDSNFDGNVKINGDVNVLGTPHFDGNFSIKRETDSVIFVCGIDALGALTCN